MDAPTSDSKARTVSSTSSASSVTEYVNELYVDSELENSKVVSIQVTGENDQSRGEGGSQKNPQKSLRDFSDISVTQDSSELIPTGFRKMYVAALIVLCFAVCMGVTATYSATATEDMKKNSSTLHPTDNEISWIGSLVAVGAGVGGTAGGFVTNLLGRKGCLVFNGAPYVIGWILIGYAQSTAMIFIGRIITGIATGIVSVAVPMYLIEISTPDVRGFLGASFQLFVVIGVLIVDGLGAALTWRWLAAAGGIMSALSSVLMFTMPESPRWLMAKDKRKEAKKALTFFQGEAFDAEAECQMIEDEIKNQPGGNIQLSEFTAPTAYKPFILAICLMFFQQFSGINAILFYTVAIFKEARVSIDELLCTIILALVQVLATLVSTFLMDRAGRKPLLYISASFMALSLLIFGGYDLAKSKDPSVIDSYGWLPVICLTVYSAAFAIGFGPAPWLMAAEMTNARFKSIVSGVSTALNWTFAFFVTYSFDSLKSGIQGYGVYWFYAAFCLLSIVMTFFFLPETKGKTIQEIDEFFDKKK